MIRFTKTVLLLWSLAGVWMLLDGLRQPEVAIWEKNWIYEAWGNGPGKNQANLQGPVLSGQKKTKRGIFVWAEKSKMWSLGIRDI